MDVTLQRQDLLELSDRASRYRDSMLRLRTDESRLIVSATGRVAADDPISKVVADTMLPALVASPGTANADPAELGKQARTLTAVQTRFVAIGVWPGFALSGVGPNAPEQAAVVAPATPTAFDMSPHVAAFVEAGTIKIRKPWTVALFGTLTLGIYLLVWYHRINRELRDLGALCGAQGRELDVKPGRSTLAVSLGALVLVPPFISVQRTFRRIQRAERITAAPEPHLWAARAWVMFLLVLPFWTAYVQSHLNRIWREQLRRAVPPEGPAPVEDVPAVAVPIEVPAPVPSIEPWPVASPEAVIPSFAPPPLPPPVLSPTPPPPPPPVLAPPPPPPEPIRLVESQPPPPPRPSPPSTPPPPPAAAPKPDLKDPAIEIIRARYARGEITRSEYRALLEDLG